MITSWAAARASSPARRRLVLSWPNRCLALAPEVYLGMEVTGAL
jgi:hypothetical protein